MDSNLWVDQGEHGFRSYLAFATKFRPTAVRSHTVEDIAILNACDIRHPAALSDTSLLRMGPSSFGHEDLAPIDQQPPLLRQRIADYLSIDHGNRIDVEDIYIASGSSVIWLRELVLSAIAQHHLQQVPGKEFVRPVVLTPRGSFKCGGYVPASCGAAMQYIESDSASRWVVSISEIEAAISRVTRDQHSAVVAVIIETPTALGQVVDYEWLIALGELAQKYPKILFLQDCYSRGTEYSGAPTPLVNSVGNFASAQIASVISFRRDWGHLSKVANLSCAVTSNRYIRSRLRDMSSHSVFRTVAMPSAAQVSIATDVLSSGHFVNDVRDYCHFFGQQFQYFARMIAGGKFFIDRDTPALSCLHADAGQFAFLFLNPTLAQRAGITSSRHFAEMLLLSPRSAVMVTITDSMGLDGGNYGVGIRVNLCNTTSETLNRTYLTKLCSRLSAFIEGLRSGDENYAVYESEIDRIYSSSGSEG